MTALRGTYWDRRSDRVTCKVIGDSAHTNRGDRPLRMRNLHTGKEFWSTPEGLSRKYLPAKGIDSSDYPEPASA